jgi:hypothetical protein
MRRVLNVGGNSKAIALPAVFDGWEHVLLDIDTRGNPDVLCDARELTRLGGGAYDAVYCSHNLEHYYRHDVPKVLTGFRHVLKDDGFAFIRVPDMGEVMRVVALKDMDIEDVLYHAPAGPITVRDVIYGFGPEIERSGNDFFSHKTGFTERSLQKALHGCGFTHVYTGTGDLEIKAAAFTKEPGEYSKQVLGLPAG